jgi:hypothetical protein
MNLRPPKSGAPRLFAATEDSIATGAVLILSRRMDAGAKFCIGSLLPALMES